MANSSNSKNGMIFFNETSAFHVANVFAAANVAIPVLSC
jgi:hypothetical protein